MTLTVSLLERMVAAAAGAAQVPPSSTAGEADAGTADASENDPDAVGWPTTATEAVGPFEAPGVPGWMNDAPSTPTAAATTAPTTATAAVPGFTGMAFSLVTVPAERARRRANPSCASSADLACPVDDVPQ
jgi:hypothetical protein